MNVVMMRQKSLENSIEKSDQDSVDGMTRNEFANEQYDNAMRNCSGRLSERHSPILAGRRPPIIIIVYYAIGTA